MDAVVIDRIIEMAWEDRTPFDAIEFQFGLKESEVKALMKSNLKFSSYKLWRKRVESYRLKRKCNAPGNGNVTSVSVSDSV